MSLYYRLEPDCSALISVGDSFFSSIFAYKTWLQGSFSMQFKYA